jgi:ferredoxin
LLLATVRVHVDTTRCLGNGLCKAIAEDVFGLGENTVVRLWVDPVAEERRRQMNQAVGESGPARRCGGIFTEYRRA